MHLKSIISSSNTTATLINIESEITRTITTTATTKTTISNLTTDHLDLQQYSNNSGKPIQFNTNNYTDFRFSNQFNVNDCLKDKKMLYENKTYSMSSDKIDQTTAIPISLNSANFKETSNSVQNPHNQFSLKDKLKKRRNRTTFTSHQLNEMERIFQV